MNYGECKGLSGFDNKVSRNSSVRYLQTSDLNQVLCTSISASEKRVIFQNEKGSLFLSFLRCIFHTKYDIFCIENKYENLCVPLHDIKPKKFI